MMQGGGAAATPAGAASEGDAKSGGDKKDEFEAMQLGDYRLGATIGKGSFGKVKLAQNVKTGEQASPALPLSGAVW